ncbi:hypothetical protein AWC23_04525 [Mycobacterium saskatchewanense]|uniref:Uncharacterized protein n=1 Tax=Mycobacterium saskatchewanense TaxID=220927 RepID=A0AAJ3NUU0_9MYCO|nr:hypothetical protein AWC23_04525 [Mycobacterium saskatchewanense]
MILTSPAGQTSVTTPGSALLFPSLCHAVGGMPTLETPPDDYCAPRTAMMPTRTRAQHHAARITTERRHNRQTRLGASAARGPDDATGDGEPPPF